MCETCQEIRYNIALTSEKNIPQNAVVGEIVPSVKKFSCEIILCDALVARYEMRDLFVSMLPLKPMMLPQYKLIITADFLSRLQRRDSNAFFKLYHEIGHIHNQDLINPRTPPEEQKEMELSGVPTPEDLAADCFAKKYMGLKNTVEGLKTIRKEREEQMPKVACSDRSETDKASLLEIDRRLESIQLKSGISPHACNGDCSGCGHHHVH